MWIHGWCIMHILGWIFYPYEISTPPSDLGFRELLYWNIGLVSTYSQTFVALNIWGKDKENDIEMYIFKIGHRNISSMSWIKKKPWNFSFVGLFLGRKSSYSDMKGNILLFVLRLYGRHSKWRWKWNVYTASHYVGYIEWY